MAESIDRMQRLQKMLEREPNDTFLLYAMAMEHKKAKDFGQAQQYLRRVLENDPAYCVAYLQSGQAHEMAGDYEAAKKAYAAGVAAAAKKGDMHARDEMQAALTAIERFEGNK